MIEPKPRAPYTPASPETWELIRAPYLRGAEARELSEHFGVTKGAIWKRAWRHGWTKLAWAARREVESFPEDHLSAPAPAPEPADVDDDILEIAADPAALAKAALKAAARALARERPAEVQAYLRAADLAARPAREAQAEADAEGAAAEADEAKRQASERRTLELRAELQNRLDRLRAHIEQQKAGEERDWSQV